MYPLPNSSSTKPHLLFTFVSGLIRAFFVGDGVGMPVLSVVILEVTAFAGEEALGLSGFSGVSQSMVEVAATFFGFGWIAFS